MAVKNQGRRNKQRGYEFEAEIVQLASDCGLDNPVRTWGSNGMSRDLPKNVDGIVCDQIHLQCKRQKRKVSKRYLPDDNIHAQLVRGDYQDPYAVLRAEDYFRMLKILSDNDLLGEVIQFTCDES